MRANKLSCLLLIFISALTSCGGNSFVAFNFNETFQTQKVAMSTEQYYRNETYNSISYRARDGIKTINTYRDLYSSKSNTNPQSFINAESIGEINALVIPVNFLDTNKSKNNTKLTNIKNAFFGQSSKTSYYSVSEYYYKTSYGQLKFNGFVTDFYTFPKTIAEMQKVSKSVSTSRRIAAYALDWFYNTYPDVDISKFDIDNDKYIDALYLIYDHPYTMPTNTDELFWAYVDHTYRNEGRDGEIRNNHETCVSTYAWISYDFLKKNGTNKPDTRTLIHESGHIFGLEDYYNTSNNGVFQPTGFMDMMDCNIGDHTAFSKMLLNWVTPIVIKDETTINIHPFSSSGDLILIPTSKGWNGTPYDEYLLLEFYSPVQTNSKDAGVKYNYINSNGEKGSFKFFSKPGLKVYHVDARLGLFETKNSGVPFALLDDVNLDEKIDKYINEKTNNYCIDFAFDNSPTYYQDKPVLYHLLERGGDNTFKEGNPGGNETLFVAGDNFNNFNFTFNNGGSLPFTFKIDLLNKNNIQLTFLK